ncbi:MAG: phosphotransferase family protein [Acidimicrobiia bacterium]
MPEPVPDAGEVAAAFGLPAGAGPLVPVAGAWTNRVFRLVAGGEAYAVKEVRNPWDLPEWFDRIDEAWRLEQATIAAGVPAPAPVPNPRTSGWRADVDGGAGEPVPVRVHRWVDGDVVPRVPTSEAIARWCGEVLAAIHALAMQPLRPEVFPAPDASSAQRWPALVEALEAADVAWVDLAHRATPSIEVIAELQRAVADEPTRMGHRDIDQKNLLLTATGPVLCDWDVAGPEHPRVELVDVAVSMARWERPEVARAVLDGYRGAGGDVGPITAADLAPTLRSALDWVVLNVERALGRRGTEADRRLGEQHAPELLAALPGRVEAALAIEAFLAEPA